MAADAARGEPGEFSTIEAAERAAGFAIPHPRDISGWRLESVRVRSASYGAGDAEAVEAFRFVTTVFASEPPGRFFHVSSHPSDGTLQPMGGDGDTSEMVVAGRRTLLHTMTGSFYANWLDNGLHVSINGFLHPQDSRAFSPTTAFESVEAFNAYAATLPPLDIEDVLRIVESTR